MNFQEFCKKTASKNVISIDKTITNCVLDERYKVAVESLVAIMKNKMGILDKVSVPFIEAAFDEDYTSILKEKYPEGDIPEEIMVYLSEALYHTHPSVLDEVKSSIIKVLTTYICIQN